MILIRILHFLFFHLFFFQLLCFSGLCSASFQNLSFFPKIVVCCFPYEPVIFRDLQKHDVNWVSLPLFFFWSISMSFNIFCSLNWSLLVLFSKRRASKKNVPLVWFRKLSNFRRKHDISGNVLWEACMTELFCDTRKFSVANCAWLWNNFWPKRVWNFICREGCNNELFRRIIFFPFRG